MRIMSEQMAIKADLASGMTQQAVAQKWGTSTSQIAKVVGGTIYAIAPWPNGDIGRMPDFYRKTARGTYQQIVNRSDEAKIADMRRYIASLDFSHFKTEFEVEWAKTLIIIGDYHNVEDLIANWKDIMADEYKTKMNMADEEQARLDKQELDMLEAQERQRKHEEDLAANPDSPRDIAEFELDQEQFKARYALGPVAKNNYINLPSVLMEIDFDEKRWKLMTPDEQRDKKKWAHEMIFEMLYRMDKPHLAHELAELWNTDNWSDPPPKWKLDNIAKANDL